MIVSVNKTSDLNNWSDSGEKEFQTCSKSLFWWGKKEKGEGEGGMFQENSIETCMVSRMKQITSPGWMHETSARTWCTGKT